MNRREIEREIAAISLSMVLGSVIVLTIMAIVSIISL